MTIHAHGACWVSVRTIGDWSSHRKESMTLTWDENDPAAVTLTIDETPWKFDRILLEDALADMTKPWPVQAIGDVTVSRPGMSQLVITLRSPDGEAKVTAFARVATGFVQQVRDACPDPVYDVDAWIGQLLREDAS